MYDANYESYLDDMHTELLEAGYVTKKSGEKAQHSDGVVRDTDKGKTKYTLMFPEGVPMKNQLIVRIAELYTRGGDVYGDRNWENSSSRDTLKHHTEALWRHFMNFFFDVQDGEDHAAAVVWNVNAVDLTRRNIAKKEAEAATETPAKTDYDPFKSYLFPYIGKNTASTGKYHQKKILAENYADARRLFDNWLSRQPHYNTFPDMPAPELSEYPDSELEWSEGDVLQEVRDSLGWSPRWVYKAESDVWLYHYRDRASSPESARSFKKLCEEFGPLKCTKGSHTGRVVDVS